MHRREMTNAASLVVGKAGVWVRDSLLVSLAIYLLTLSWDKAPRVIFLIRHVFWAGPNPFH